MTTNKQYVEKVEKEFGQELREIMYDLCVDRDVVPSQGALKLGVPKSTFINWRSYFRFGPKQLIADKSKELRRKDISRYNEQLEDIDIKRDFNYKNQQSIDGLKEIIERLLEFEKYKITKSEQDPIAKISMALKVTSLETTLEYVEKYTNGALYHDFVKELNYLKENNITGNKGVK